MASNSELDSPLDTLRRSIATPTSTPPILTTTADPSGASDTVTSLAHATHLSFNFDAVHKTFALTAPTRFAPADKPVDLRSVYFAWLNKDAPVTEYLTAVQNLNEELPSGAGGSVQNLSFPQRIELIEWLGGDAESSESIAPLDGASASAAAGGAAAIAGGKGVPLQKAVPGVGGQKLVDERLLQIYDGERKMGDHNSMLRGTKPTDFSVYRKVAASFLRSRPSAPTASSSHPHPAPLVSSLQKKPPRRVEPIILLSPSASSLLRMSNIKSFLDTGVFIPPNAADTTSTNLLHLTRVIPSISSQPIRFVLLDSTTAFKPAYWDRVVAIFTTGQSWQFKSYKYPNPAELFAHYPGVFVGWQGEEPPEQIQAWGRGVMAVKVDKWTGSEKGRWRDREVVERIWGRIEETMKRGAWTRDGPGMAGAMSGR
ncbi:RNA pol II accessory factor, Cdc73 family-domain-containing protein [Massariosphaeria phaeospora]|uniref:RNA pol II accessory factor, Cdc73 family-domain-containing protein n=1 Tax=Massariosphaeria phaeospora TaxID=100035 RepID=A0A7C8IEE9_9PLEO|nr:RNA pol II accessory factor, Cdc73 family-domain-containing protein [Massariosphaeria phaeospora]